MSQALVDFRQQMGLVDQLIAIHGRLRTGRGRRYEQDALHRAGVVMTVAAWQAYVEKVLAEALDAVQADLEGPGGAPNWSIHTFLMRRAVIENAIKKFNTPDDVRVRDLFRDSLAFDPWPSWVWRRGPRQWQVAFVRQRTNDWVIVRHSVAHGFALPDRLNWLQDANGRARLTLNLLEECRRHFIHLATATDNAFADHLATRHRLARPW